MKWISLVVTMLLQILIVWGIGFMHNTTAIISFFTISLLIGVILKESREDMPARPKKILSGVMLGINASAAIISFLIYLKFIAL